MTTPRTGPHVNNTPSYQPTPRPMVGPGAPWPGATPRTPAARTPRHDKNQASSAADMDWARAAEMWANRKKTTKSPRASPRPSPRTAPSPARKGFESPFGGSSLGGASPQGDGTPLVDER